MNIFKALSIIINSTVAVMTKGLKAIENVAEMAELTTDGMLEEQRIESARTLEELKQSLAVTKAKAPTASPKKSK